MKKQVVVIHGGRTFKTYQEYIRSIRNREVSIDKFKIQKNWKDSLEKKLGENFEVFAPHMPNGNNAVYEEWKIWFCRMVEFINDDAIFIGHSLGGIFLAKYICENTCSKKIKAVILVAAPFNEDNMKECLGNFVPCSPFQNFCSQVKKTYLLFSKDDPVVPFKEAHKYKKAIPNSKIITFDDRQHFNQTHFPEIIELIKKL